MSDPLIGKVEFQNSKGETVFTVDPDARVFQIVTNPAGTSVIQLGDEFGNVHMPNDCIAQRYFANTKGGQIIIGDEFGNIHMPNDCIAQRYLANTKGGQIVIGDEFGNVHLPNDCIAKRHFTHDVFLSGADCAEHFDVVDMDTLEPGTVMVLNKDGILQECQQAYDKKVAGVISGAGNHKTGLTLDKQESEVNRRPLALIGKVYCKVDACYSAVEVGDMLTTSSTIGYAMKAKDPVKAFGSVIGKALRSLQSGQGLIPILVALQ